MSFIADKKREHENAAEKALTVKDYSRAFFHTAKAAEFGLALAEQSEGKIAKRYVEDSFELIEIAKELKAKAKTNAPKKTREALNEASGGEEDSPKTQWELKERPTEKLDDVAGLDDVKQELREKVIEPFVHPEIYERFKVKVGGGILMYGPPGNGKTFIAKAVAGELDAAFFNVNASQVKDKYVGETEKNIRKLFEEARGHERAVIFLDEMDALLSKRGNRKIGSVNEFLSQMDGLVKNRNCLLVLGATNKPWVLDDAIIRPGRMGTHIYVGPPDAAAREAILAHNMREVPAAEGVVLQDIASKTEGYSGADMAELCDRAKRCALNRQLATDTEQSVNMDDFTVALQKVRPSITPELLKQFETWRDARLAPTGAGEDDD